MLSRYESLESDRLVSEKNLVTLFDKGLWLRQMEPEEKGYVVLHAERINLPAWEMKNVMALSFDREDGFRERIDAGTAVLSNGQWIFYGAVIHQPQKQVDHRPTLTIPTDLTTRDIEESFARNQDERPEGKQA